ncbi:hypothetical protein M407DRAFT_25454 [Tulasnella calospora MUT 4182]|uniref:ubiquitinyl hydrolase 1 n=1 Tax=Tulasnella calospora MUT 4182 TaxID=1051891 RepID=A0A0C3LV11_9AGAM|nr:hypothetical protein M407DRAFT_25454 [Tulasnella calospora MUT 4182]
MRPSKSNGLQSLLHDLNINPQYLTLAILACTVLILIGAPMFESLLGYIWNSPPPESSSSSSSYRRSRRKSTASGAPRTRAEQLRQRGETTGGSGGEGSSSAPHIDDVYYPGLVNISGTYCFLNSTLQALASLSYLQPQIESSRTKAEEWDVPTPVIDALRDTLNSLNTPHHRQKAFRPEDIIEALSRPDPKGNRSRSRLFSSREHQDAQELFQLVSSCLQEEAIDVDAEVARDHGLAEVHRDDADHPRKDVGSKNVFEGLTANRRSCVQCGYTEAVMHFSFDNVTLPIPRASQCKLEDCLAEYTRMETLDDCVCRKCSMLATLSELKEEADHLAEHAAAKKSSQGRQRKADRARALQQAVQAALDNNRIEQDIPGVELKKVTSSCSTKQAMIARPPPVLVLHLNRSAYYGYGHASKNSCAVMFPEILDLTPYTTSGALSTIPSSPISSHPNGSTKTPSTRSSATPILYRLAAIVCHYGSHGFGHFVTYRRKPRPSSSGRSSRHVAQLGHPRIAHSLDCTCSTCAMLGRIRDYEPPDPNKPDVAPEKNGRGWLRISDDQVEEVGLKNVLSEVSGTFMLYYERVLVDLGSSGRPRKVSLSRKTPPPALHVDTAAGAKMQPYIHVTMSASAASSSGGLPGSAVDGGGRSLRNRSQPQGVILSSPRSSEETVTQDNVRLSRASSPGPGEEDEDPGTPKAASASQELPSVEFPKSAMSRSSSGRIVRNVTLAPLPTNFSRSRTTSGASSRSAASASPIVVSAPPLSGLSGARSYGAPSPLVMETNPSPLPPGSARTKARFTPPATPLVLPTPINLVPEPREEKEELGAEDREYEVIERESEHQVAHEPEVAEPEPEPVHFPEPEPIRFPEPEVIQPDTTRLPEPEPIPESASFPEPLTFPEPEPVQVAPEPEVVANGSAEAPEDKDEKDKPKEKKKKKVTTKSSKKDSKMNGGPRT